ncbi:hypothetical protein SCWH03_47330 [Streptomyces pacificus]|uniref:Uncharacterized protein n=1 Tax=Streptomyces pacificus TaxID=2705029 RepID=A0A6A0B1L2_9ACTN|nr:hypothetical protein SCWH03_47330 [Streptomyces pacificus]
MVGVEGGGDRAAADQVLRRPGMDTGFVVDELDCVGHPQGQFQVVGADHDGQAPVPGEVAQQHRERHA